MNATQPQVKSIFHKTTGAEINVEGRKNSEIIADVKKAGFSLGAKALATLIKGEALEAGDFTIVKPEVKPEEPQQPAPAVAAPTGTAAPATAETAVAKAVRAKQPSLMERVLANNAHPKFAIDQAKLDAMTPDQKAIALAELEEQRKAVLAAEKHSFRGTDWTKVLPQKPVAVKEGSKVHALLQYLCTAGGVTKEEIMTKFGWSAGGLAGILHWEPKAKGYFLKSEKGGDGKLRYSLTEIGTGRAYSADEIAVKAAPAPKAPKAPKAAPAAGDAAAKKVRVPSEGMDAAQANMTGGASVTKRVAAKKTV